MIFFILLTIAVLAFLFAGVVLKVVFSALILVVLIVCSIIKRRRQS